MKTRNNSNFYSYFNALLVNCPQKVTASDSLTLFACELHRQMPSGNVSENQLYQYV